MFFQYMIDTHRCVYCGYLAEIEPEKAELECPKCSKHQKAEVLILEKEVYKLLKERAQSSRLSVNQWLKTILIAEEIDQIMA